MLKFSKYIWNRKKKKSGHRHSVSPNVNTEKSDSVAKYKLVICYYAIAAQKHSSPCCRSLLWRGYHHWPSSLQHFFEAIVKASKKHVLIKNWFEMSALWEEGASTAGWLFFFLFLKYKRIKTFLVRKKTQRKRSQKSDRAMNLIAIAIIFQMTNNKESIIQRMISEVKSTKLLWGENQLSPFAAAQPTICKCTEVTIVTETWIST